MSPTAVPTRITVDFRDDLHPSRTWILGLDVPSERVDLLAFETPLPTRTADLRPLLRRRPAAALLADCTCPEFCERDHANE